MKLITENSRIRRILSQNNHLEKFLIFQDAFHLHVFKEKSLNESTFEFFDAEYQISVLNLKELLYLLGLQNMDMLKDFVYRFYGNEGGYYRLPKVVNFKVFVPDTETI